MSADGYHVIEKSLKSNIDICLVGRDRIHAQGEGMDKKEPPPPSA
jgi:hypothetical protein